MFIQHQIGDNNIVLQDVDVHGGMPAPCITKPALGPRRGGEGAEGVPGPGEDHLVLARDHGR